MAEQKFILASGSPRRIELLRRLLPEFESVPSHIQESAVPMETPEEMAMDNAMAKAIDVSEKHPDATVIGADTIVILDGHVLGKPSDEKEAIAMLEMLSGKTHTVVTGIAIVNRGLSFMMKDSEITHVKFRKLTRESISVYVLDKQPMDKAGGYGIQEVGDSFVESFKGSYENVMGLPLELTAVMLRQLPV